MPIHFLPLRRSTLRIAGVGELLRERGPEFDVAVATTPVPVPAFRPRPF